MHLHWLGPQPCPVLLTVLLLMMMHFWLDAVLVRWSALLVVFIIASIMVTSSSVIRTSTPTAVDHQQQ